MTATADASDRHTRRVPAAPRQRPAGGLGSPKPPDWLREVIGKTARPIEALSGGDLTVWIAESSSATLLHGVVRSAGALDDLAFERSVAQLYDGLGALLRKRGEFAVRFWNYVPGIRKAAQGGISRYEIFNAGRFRGFERWSKGDERCEQFAASSGVGHPGDDLVVHALACTSPGKPLENPRQRPAYRYSRRYGPLPPCFSRATVLSRPLATAAGAVGVLVAGTASIVGENSLHVGDLAAQAKEICRNLAALRGVVVGGVAPDELGRGVGSYRHLRMYVVDEGLAPEATELLASEGFPTAELDVVQADLCRPELLIEVEGTLPPLEAESSRAAAILSER